MLINNKLVYKNATYYGILIEKETGLLAQSEATILLYDTGEMYYDESPISIQKLDIQFLPKGSIIGTPFSMDMTINTDNQLNMNMKLDIADIDYVYDLIDKSDKYLSKEVRDILKQTKRDLKINKCIN
jgi:hypothetical protein